MTSEADVCEVIITAPDASWLAEFTARLLTDRLCAAAHTFEPIRSEYWWQGKIHSVAEVRAALHTRRSHVPQIVDRTNREHPYDVPCVAVLPIIGGSHDYLAWILRETQALTGE